MEEDLKFLRFDENQNKLIFDKYTQEDDGNYTITVVLSDKRGMKREYDILVTVI